MSKIQEIQEIKTTAGKYYNSRFSLWSKYSQGIKMDRESWFSVTPEVIAIHIAQRLSCNTIIDAFCGSGGNAIQFAKTCKRVIAIDIDEMKIEMAKHNATIYGVDNIEFIVGDAMDIIPSLEADCCFLSPPWGGVEYSRSGFDIQSMNPDGIDIFNLVKMVTPNIAYYLPRSLDSSKVISLADKVCEIEEVHLNDRGVKCILVYYGDLITKEEDEF